MNAAPPSRAPAPDPLLLPGWAIVSEKRRAHIARVTLLLETWAAAMSLDVAEAIAWRDAGLWHDALRDAPAETLQALAPDSGFVIDMLHGPAAATMLRRNGERRSAVLDAVEFHTVGHAAWGRTGRALYMADYLEPGRTFAREDRAFLAAHVPHDFDGVFRQVVRQRIEWALREGKTLYREGVDMWNGVR